MKKKEQLVVPAHFFVSGNPVPKPVMLHGSHLGWNKNKTIRYRMWQDRVRDVWKKESGKRYKSLRLGCIFHIPGRWNVDLSNLIKGVEDSLKDYELKNSRGTIPLHFAIIDDNIDVIASYSEMRAIRECDVCEDRETSGCGIGRVENCPKAGVEIFIEGEEMEPKI